MTQAINAKQNALAHIKKCTKTKYQYLYRAWRTMKKAEASNQSRAEIDIARHSYWDAAVNFVGRDNKLNAGAAIELAADNFCQDIAAAAPHKFYSVKVRAIHRKHFLNQDQTNYDFISDDDLDFVGDDEQESVQGDLICNPICDPEIWREVVEMESRQNQLSYSLYERVLSGLALS